MLLNIQRNYGQRDWIANLRISRLRDAVFGPCHVAGKPVDPAWLAV